MKTSIASQMLMLPYLEPGDEDFRELALQIEDQFDQGKSVDETLKFLELEHSPYARKLCLRIVKDRTLRKLARLKRFGSVEHLRPGWTRADQLQKEWNERGRPTPNMQWSFERDASVEERLNAPLPVKREKGLMGPPAQPIRPPHFRSRGLLSAPYNISWRNNDDYEDSIASPRSTISESYSVDSTPMSLASSKLYSIDRQGSTPLAFPRDLRNY